MKLNKKQIKILKELMTASRKKGNIATSAIVLDKSGNLLGSADSVVASDHDATAHAELRLVSRVGKKLKNNYTPGLIMVTVLESCLMCMSACSQAGYEKMFYIIPAKRYLSTNPLMTDVNENVDKTLIANNFSDPIKLIHLKEYEEEFCQLFEELTKKYKQLPPKD